MSHALVTLHNVSVELGGHAILRGITTAIEKEKLTALVGWNGSGKTTLLRTLLHELPYRGRIEFRCAHDHTQRFPTHIGYVPQRLQLTAQLPLSVRDLMALALQRRPLFLGVSPRAEQRMRELLHQVRLPLALLGRPVDRISGGELQRVLLALALHPQPELLLLDEAASAIDYRDRQPYYRLIRELNQSQRITILLVSHDLKAVESVADRVIGLQEGRVCVDGLLNEAAVEEFLRNSALSVSSERPA